MKKRILHCFNKRAETYDESATIQAAVAERLAKKIVHVPASSILEMGCGTGLLTKQLLPHFSKSHIHLVDIAPAMIAFCQKRFEKESLHFSCMDGEEPKFDKKYDLIVSSMTLHWFNNIKKSIEVFKNQLLPKGRLIFSMLGKNSLFEWHDICRQHDFPIPTPSFPDRMQLQSDFPELQITTEIMTERYETIYHFLTTLKKIGATATHPFYQPLSSGKMRTLLRQYQKEITISYEVIYGTYIHG